jgi:hypothetical protein
LLKYPNLKKEQNIKSQEIRHKFAKNAIFTENYSISYNPRRLLENINIDYTGTIVPEQTKTHGNKSDMLVLG